MRRGANDDHVGARYVTAISLITLFVALFAAFVAVQALTDLVVDHKERAAINAKVNQEGSYAPVPPGYGPGGPVTSLGNDIQSYQFSHNNDANYNTAVASGLAALTAGAVFLYHRRRRMAMVGARGYATSSAAVVNRTYLQGVKAVAALTVALAARLRSTGSGRSSRRGSRARSRLTSAEQKASPRSCRRARLRPSRRSSSCGPTTSSSPERLVDRGRSKGDRLPAVAPV